MVGLLGQNMYKKINIIISLFFLLVSTNIFATTYQLPPVNESLIGQMKTIISSNGDTVVSIAKQYDVGFNAMESANPYLEMTRQFPVGLPLKIPTQHLLPNLPRQGIVVNLPEMRMYYYPKGTGQVFTYPIGIGKIGKTIPIKFTSIVRKAKNPIWVPTQNIREFNLQQGVVLPRIMPAGPDNPLGNYAIYTGIPTYLVHSTIFPESIGKRASFGCIRMYEPDIQDFFPSIKIGIPVAIVNSPVKVGWQNDYLYIEAHTPLQEHGDSDDSVASMVHLVSNAANGPSALIDWQLVAYLSENRDGIPHEVGIRIR